MTPMLLISQGTWCCGSGATPGKWGWRVSSGLSFATNLWASPHLDSSSPAQWRLTRWSLPRLMLRWHHGSLGAQQGQTPCNREALTHVWKVCSGPLPSHHLEWEMDNGLPIVAPPKNTWDGSSLRALSLAYSTRHKSHPSNGQAAQWTVPSCCSSATIVNFLLWEEGRGRKR